jgi:transcription elongation factor Elf1
MKPTITIFRCMSCNKKGPSEMHFRWWDAMQNENCAICTQCKEIMNTYKINFIKDYYLFIANKMKTKTNEGN